MLFCIPMSADSATLNSRSEQKFYASSWVDGFIGIPKEIVVMILDHATRKDLSTLVAVQKVRIKSQSYQIFF